MQSPHLQMVFSEEDKKELRCAFEKVQRSIDIDPLIQSFHLLAIQLAVMLDDQKDVYAVFDYAISLFPDDYRLRAGYASYLLNKSDQRVKAAAILEEGLLRIPENISLRMETAEMLAFSNRDPEAASELIFQTLKMDELPHEIMEYLVLFSFRLAKEGDKKQAAEILNKTATRSTLAVETAIPQAVGSGCGEAALNLIEYSLETLAPPQAFLLYAAFLCVLLDRFEEAAQKLDEPELVQAAQEMKRSEFPKLMHCFILTGKGSTEKGIEELFSLLNEYPLCLEAFAKLLELNERYPASVDHDLLLERMYRAKEISEDPGIRQWLYRAYAFLKRGNQK